jgi:peptide/nickel transport system substrate-binding protein
MRFLLKPFRSTLGPVAMSLALLAACAPPPPAAQPTTVAQPPKPAATTPPGGAPPAAVATTAPTAGQAAPAAPAPTQVPAAAKPAGTPKPGGVLRIGGETDFADLDPHTARVGWDINMMQNVYSGLVRAGQDLLPAPDLATEWQFTDPQTLVFTLRQGVKFHNGRTLVADDVKYSLERLLDPNVPAGFASYIESVGSIEATDATHVTLRLKRPDAAIVNNLAMPTMAIVAREAVEPQPVGLKNTMMGTGPFKFKEFIPGQKLVLVKNPDYFVAGQPLLDELDFIPLSDETARTNALRSGEVDYIEPAAPKHVQSLRSDRTLQVSGGPNLSFVGISLNTTRKPFDDQRVRQALAYAIGRDEVIQKAFEGFAQPLWGPPLIPPYWAGNTDQYYSYDQAKAKALLAEAGLPNGFKTTIKTGVGTSYHRPFAEVIQSELKKIGVEVEIIAQDGSVSVKDWNTGNFDMYPIRWWGSDFIDPDGALRPLFTCKGSYNNSRLCDTTFDDLIVKGLATTAPDARKQVYHDAMKELAAQQPWVFLVAFDRFQAMKANVAGYVAYPNASQYGFRGTWLDK